jgi:hypothetical protein
MNVLGHWVCEACGRSGPDPLKLTHPKLGNEGQRCHGPVVRVEYVPRSELQGAVEEIGSWLRSDNTEVLIGRAVNDGDDVGAVLAEALVREWGQ